MIQPLSLEAPEPKDSLIYDYCEIITIIIEMQVTARITFCEISSPASSILEASRVKNESKLSSIISLASIYA